MARRKPAKRRSLASKRPTQSKALRADGGHFRRAAPTPPAANSRGLPMVEVMGRAMAAYAELPGRLLACTSPVQFWAEYLRFGQRLFSGFQPVSLERSQAGKVPKRAAKKKAGR